MKPQAATARHAAGLLLDLDAARLTRALYHLEAHELVRLIELLERARDQGIDPSPVLPVITRADHPTTTDGGPPQ